MGSIAMTALIGRVPIDGTVNDPYPFKVLIGPDNLTANGIDIPDVAGAVVSGTASGDWTLSCVRGQIRSVTFVFQDGTIRTVPEDSSKGGSSGGNSGHNGASIQGGLGWISDPYGIPCVSGERRSNPQQYLGSQALITAAGAGAASLIKSDNGSVAVVANNNGSLGTVGISGNEAMGRNWRERRTRHGAHCANNVLRPGLRGGLRAASAPRWPCISSNTLDIGYDAEWASGPRTPHRDEAHASDWRLTRQTRRWRHALLEQLRHSTGELLPDAGRHTPGRAGGAPQPPRQEGRRRNPGLGADPARRAAGARPDRQRAQALPRCAGILCVAVT
ncbi:hypothetical protein RLIN73S_04194 [Rhodanobacter lindaniclasticus]